MNTGSDLRLSSGCRDRLMVASSVACIVALFISILGLARAMFDVTWPLGRSGAGLICLQVGHDELDLPSSTWASTGTNMTIRSQRPAAGLEPTITPMPATATLRQTMTAVPPKATLAPKTTPMLPAPTLVPPAALATTMPITADLASSAATGHLFPTPMLLSPEPDAQLQGGVHFQWQWDGEPLPEGLAFDLLIWSEAEHQEHQGTGAYGVIETDPTLERDVDLDFVETIIEHGGGTYFWAVIVVQEGPYERVGALGETRPFTYVVPDPPAEPTTQSP
jgi:hypothetical protein